MPSPKSGTVAPDVAKAVADFVAGKVDFRVDSAGNVHVPVGKASFSADKLTENASALLDYIVSLRPATAKGIYIQNLSISTSMSPGLRVAYSY